MIARKPFAQGLRIDLPWKVQYPCLYRTARLYLTLTSHRPIHPYQSDSQTHRNLSSQPSDFPLSLASPEASPSVPSPPPPPTPPTPRRRSLRPLIYATSFFLFGLTAGQFLRHTIIPPPVPTSPAIIATLRSDLAERLSRLPIVIELRSHPEEWVEWEAYDSVPTHERARRLSTGPMAGPDGLGLQRVWWNEGEGRTVSVLWLGGKLAGWPGITHGGAVATVLDEGLGRVAVRMLTGRRGVTAQLTLNYRAPTLSNHFYVLRAEVDESRAEENNQRKVWVKGLLEEEGSGKVCVEASGLFVVPKGINLKPIDERF